MARLRQIGMAAGTFSIALGIGFIMQNGDAVASRFGNETAPPQPAAFTDEAQVVAPIEVPQPAVFTQAEMVPIEVAQSGVIMASAPQNMEPQPVMTGALILPEEAKNPTAHKAPFQLAALETETAPTLETDQSFEAVTNCVPTMQATAGPVASIDLKIAAPCYVSAPFTIHHQGMMYSAMTDEAGDASLIVPALAEIAVVIAAFDNGDGAVATAVVPDFANYDRAVLQWQGTAAVMLSAYEGDAKFGDDAHIHNGNPGDMTRIETAQGGYLVRLGDGTVGDGLVADVYTYPSGMMGVDADVFLVAEAEITTDNCGQEMNAQSIQVSPNGETAALDLTMIMPECDAVGDFLVLQNMFRSLTLASK